MMCANMGFLLCFAIIGNILEHVPLSRQLMNTPIIGIVHLSIFRVFQNLCHCLGNMWMCHHKDCGCLLHYREDLRNPCHNFEQRVDKPS